MSVLAAGLLVGCDVGSTLAPTPSVTSSRGTRSSCDGSLSRALTDLSGVAADELEMLQGRYQDRPGFLAVVNDGQGPAVVVEPSTVAAWQGLLVGTGVRVAPSCVEPGLLPVVDQAIQVVELEPGAIASAGYDALDDVIYVTGITSEELAAAVGRVAPGSEERLRAAIDGGTLRVRP